MKLYLYILSFVLLFQSCCESNTGIKNRNSSNSKITVVRYSDTIVVTDEFETDQPIKEGGKTGFVKQTTNKYGTCETQMMTQFDEYNKAISNRDYNKCLGYINEDGLKYFQRLAAADGQPFELNDIALWMAQDLNELQEKIKNKGVEFEIVIASLERRIDKGNNVFVVFTNATNLTGENGKKFHLFPLDKTLAISNDKGKNWTFWNYDDEVPNVFSGVYDEELIDVIMDY